MVASNLGKYKNTLETRVFLYVSRRELAFAFASLANVDCSSTEVFAIKAVDSCFTFVVAFEFYESETTRTSSFTVIDDVGACYCSEL